MTANQDPTKRKGIFSFLKIIFNVMGSLKMSCLHAVKKVSMLHLQFAEFDCL